MVWLMIITRVPFGMTSPVESRSPFGFVTTRGMLTMETLACQILMRESHGSTCLERAD